MINFINHLEVKPLELEYIKMTDSSTVMSVSLQHYQLILSCSLHPLHNTLVCTSFNIVLVTLLISDSTNISNHRILTYAAEVWQIPSREIK